MSSAGNPVVRARVSKSFKDLCQTKADRMGIDLSAVVRAALAEFVTESDEESAARLAKSIEGVATP